MNWWKRFKSRVSGKIPTVNDLDLDSIGINSADGKVFIKKRTEEGVESIVEVGSGGGGGESHLRAHQINSADDHPAVAEADRNKLVATNPDTGAIELIAKSAVGVNYWQKTSTTLSPATSGDKVKVTVSGSDTAIEGVSDSGIAVIGTTASNAGVKGVASANGNGVYGQSSSGNGVYTTSSSGYALLANSSGNIAVYAISSNAVAGYFISLTSAITASSSPSSNNSIHSVINLIRSTSGTAASGIGGSIRYSIENTSGTAVVAGAIAILLTDANNSTLTSDFTINLRNNGATDAEVLRLTGAGVLEVKSGFKVDGTGAVADGTYTVGKGASQDGTITVKGGIITAIQEAAD